MRVLYVFPHPDDESFGPAGVMHKQIREGHEVFLLTLTKFGTVKHGVKLDLSENEIGEIRRKEMLKVSETLELTGLSILDFNDSKLKNTDPRVLESAVIKGIQNTKPNVVVTYPIHGITGFEDHIITHSIVKRAFVEAKDEFPFIKRLAFYTLTEEQANSEKRFPLIGSGRNDIDCIVEITETDIEKNRRALDCYVTYKEVIEKTQKKEHINRYNAFEFFKEDFAPPVNELFEGLRVSQ